MLCTYLGIYPFIYIVRQDLNECDFKVSTYGMPRIAGELQLMPEIK